MKRSSKSQLYLSPQFRPRFEHGGAIRSGKRKLRRPFDPKQALHGVMRASRAKGAHSMLHRKNRSRVNRWVYDWAKRSNIRLIEWANVGNHLHFVVRAQHRENLQTFLRGFPGVVSMGILGGRKGHKTGRFWDALAYSRVVRAGGRAFEALRKYIQKNRIEAAGFDREWLDEVFKKGMSLEELFDFANGRAPP